jgi:Bacterial alpha-L-rhamnosidase.
MRGLTQYGNVNLAYKIATNETYPSWGHMVKNGATTIWELWNGETADPAMNSGNHVMLLGDLLIWYYEDLAGIKCAPGSVAYKKLLMEPNFPKALPM